MKNKPDRISIFLNEENDFSAKKLKFFFCFPFRGVEPKPASKKPSRFYRRDEWSDPRSDRGSSPGGGYNVYDLADDILGENVRPSREPALPSRRLTHPRPGLNLLYSTD